MVEQERGVLVVRDKSRHETDEARALDPRVAGVVMALVAAVVPYIVSIDAYGVAIMAATWVLEWSPQSIWFFLLSPEDWFGIVLLIIVLPEAAFACQMMRLYSGKTTKKQTFLVGLLGTLPLITVDVMNTLPLLWNPTWPYGFTWFPVPVIVLVGYLLVKRYPPLEQSRVWPELDRGTDLWSQS